MWLQFFAFQCLVDRHWGQSHTGVGWYLPKGRYCVILGQDIRLEWGPLQMVHSSLGLSPVGHPVGHPSVLVCLFVCFVCFCSLTLGFLSFSSLLILIVRLNSPNHTCSSRLNTGCISLYTGCSMSVCLSGFFVVWVFLGHVGFCWVGFEGMCWTNLQGKKSLDN